MDKFVLFDENFRNPQPPSRDENGNIVPAPPAAVVTTALDEASAVVAAASYLDHPEYTWVEYDIEDDNLTRCNGRIRDDLPPHTQ